MGQDISKTEQLVIETLHKSSIDLTGKIILIDNKYIEGKPVDITISDDNNWVCIPVENNETTEKGEYTWKPKCLQIISQYNFFIDIGNIIRKTNVKLLNKA
jgi:hypothetical protein